MWNTAPHTPGFFQFCAAFCYIALRLQLWATFATLSYFCLLSANTHSHTHPAAANLRPRPTRLVLEHLCHVWGWPCGIQLPMPRASCNFVQLCAAFATLSYFCLLSANTHSQTHPPAADLHSMRTRPVPEHLCYAIARPCEIRPPVPGLHSTLYGFVQLFFATLCYALPIPTAKRTHLQQTCTPGARGRCQGPPAT